MVHIREWRLNSFKFSFSFLVVDGLSAAEREE
jgi:hypothetical protein